MKNVTGKYNAKIPLEKVILNFLKMYGYNCKTYACHVDVYYYNSEIILLHISNNVK